VQLYGVDPVVMGDAVRRVVDLGVDHLDLNFGCPAAKVTRKGGGAALPVHHVLFRDIVRTAVGAAGGIPVTVKLRMGVDDTHLTYLDAARAAEDEGASAVSLHARTAEQLYSGDARWEAIAALKDAVRTIPVLGNGDIWEASDALAMVEATGCDGVVVGRGCLGRPWLFRDLAAAFAGTPIPSAPALGEVMDTMRLHLRLLVDLLGADGACRDFRKHTSWYVTGFPVGAERRKQLSAISTVDELERLLADLDPATPFPTDAHRMKRGHTRGPRPVALPPGWLDSVDDPRPPAGAELLVSGG
jgi:nifR3 family TIM-barrel protein